MVSAVVTWLRSLDPLWMFLIIAASGGIIISLISFILRKGIGLSKYRQLRKQEDEIDRLKTVIEEYNTEGRQKRIELRKPLLELPNLLSELEIGLSKLAEEISGERITENEEFKELSYNTSRLKIHSERDNKETNDKINKLLYRTGDSELSRLLDVFRNDLNSVLSDRCYNHYRQKYHKTSLEELYNMNKVDEIMTSALSGVRAKLVKRWEDLCCYD